MLTLLLKLIEFLEIVVLVLVLVVAEELFTGIEKLINGIALLEVQVLLV